MTVNSKSLFVLFLGILFFLNCSTKNEPFIEDRFYLVEWNELVIETMKTDGINPVLATRIYLYPNIAAYEVIAHSNNAFDSYESKLNGLNNLPNTEKDININLAAITAYYQVMLTLNYREDLLNELYSEQSIIYQENLSKNIFEESIKYGQKMAKAILIWANTDKYDMTKGLPYFISNNEPGTWSPTPPEYRAALEPHWGTLRPLTLDSLSPFSKPFTLLYSENENSSFFQLSQEVYDSSFVLTEDQKKAALFWDDNPDLNNFNGHVPFPRRHLNPTAHWINIINQIIKRDDIGFEKSTELYALATIAFYDANLVCWYDKYNSNLVRPVTYIQNLIDPNWMPLLVTPPFPEHTSGHSACSAACATVLEHLLGEHYSFIDSTHYEVGLGVRRFPSLIDAAWEVSYSRFYGGIHYKTGCMQGTQQGILVGQQVINRLKK